ncbi:MAG: ACP phosphodiesterase [Marinicella sp.]|nr:DUF479 domain-containing protein [Xanthomonadales bacterium]
MNWLAHTLLSKKNIEYQLGNVLADPMKGKVWKDANDHLKQGMKMHKAIDKFTDQHQLISASKKRLGEDGHLKGVVLDLLYDHFLSINWSQFCRWELDTYLAYFNGAANQAASFYPPKPQQIVKRMVESNLLGRYRTFVELLTALERIDLRLSDRAKKKETASQYIDAIESQYTALENDFMVFFPELIQVFKTHPLGSATYHYLY